MGKNQQHKQMQRARHGGGGTDADGNPLPEVGDGTVDVSYHSPAWHAARIAALTTERVSWEDFKKKQKEDAAAEAAAAEDEATAMRAYRAQLDADRAKRLAQGTNNAHLRETAKPDKKSKKRKSKEEDKEKKRKKDKKDSKDRKRKKSTKESKDKRDKKRRKHNSSESSKSSSSSSSDSDKDDSRLAAGAKAKSSKVANEPVRLSDFLRE